MNEATPLEAGHSSLSNKKTTGAVIKSRVMPSMMRSNILDQNSLHINSTQNNSSAVSQSSPEISSLSEDKQQVSDIKSSFPITKSPDKTKDQISPDPNLPSTPEVATVAKSAEYSILRTSLSARSKKSPETEIEKLIAENKVQTAADKTEETKTVEENTKKEKQPGYNMCFLVTFIVCLTVQFCAYGRLLKIPKETPKVGAKWDPRKDLKIPIPVPFTHISDGNIAQLEEVITQHYMTVAVLYAPWSRPSLRVVNYFSLLAPNWQDADIEFVAMNCWIKGTSCYENYNSWDYPQVLIYHKDVDYIPYIYSLSTYAPAFATELERLYEPVLFVDSISELTSILGKHQRCVIGLFSGYEENEDYKEFLKAAIIHHLEYMDSYYVPFIVLSTRHVSVLESAQLKTMVYKYVLFETISPFQGRHHKLLHRELLNWLKVKGDKLSIKYLGHQGFNALAGNNNISVIFSSPLHQNSDNFVSYMRSVMSYKNCHTKPELKIHCKPNMTCLNPCLLDTTLSQDTLLPCFHPSFQAPNYVQQCYFNRQRTSLLPSPFPHAAHSKIAEDLTVLTQHTFMESELMCSESYEDKCTQCTEVEQLHSDLEFSINRAANLHHTAHQGAGCEGNNVVFYALDTVIWADLVTQFGVNNTERQFTEAITKVDSEGQNVFTIDLTNNSLEDDKFWTFLNGPEKENEKYHVNPSGINPKSENEDEPEKYSDFQKEFVHEISRVDLLSIEDDKTRAYLVFGYTKWCGYCHIMRRKVEAAARLLRSHLSLTFVAIDTDKNNNLRGSRISIDSIPSVHLYLQTSDFPVLFEHAPHKPASVKDLVRFIKKHLSDTDFPTLNSFNPRPTTPPAIPCSTWKPAPLPPDQPNIDELNLAHAQMSRIDEILEGKGDPEERGPLLQKLEEFLSELPTKATDNFPNAVLDSFKEDSPALLSSRGSLCKSVIHLFKSLSIGSGIHPYKLNSITSTLIRDLHENSCFDIDPDCLSGEKSSCFVSEVADFWSWVGKGCFKGAWEKLPCKYLIVASEIANMHDIVPIDVQLILEAKKLAVKRRALRLGLPMPSNVVKDYEIFHMAHCYNVRAEFVFYINQTCSYLCRLTCRVIYRFHQG